MSTTTIRIRNYSWGTLRTIEVGSAFTVVIHPKEAQAIALLEPACSTSFTDEQGIQWVVTRTQRFVFSLWDQVTFSTSDHDRTYAMSTSLNFSVFLADLEFDEDGYSRRETPWVS